MDELSRARAPHPVNPARRLRSVAWLVSRSLRHPQRLPAGWRTERFTRSVDRTRRQLRPIDSLVALADSYGRESRFLARATPAVAVGAPRMRRRHAPSPVEVAYATRWIELHGGRELTGWGVLSRPGTR